MITQKGEGSSLATGGLKNSQNTFADAILLRLDSARVRAGLDSYVLGVCSCDPKVSACAIAGDLALSAAQLNMGHVLLMSCHMGQSALWNRSNDGLANLIQGAAQPGEVILQGEVDHLHILPAGKRLSESLVPEHVESVLKTVRSDYDIVVVELPPVSDSVQSLLFNRFVDGVALILDSQKTRARDARAALRILEENEVQVLGTVLKRTRRTLPRFLDWF